MRLRKLAQYVVENRCPIRNPGTTSHTGETGLCPACEQQLRITVLYVDEGSGAVRYSGRAAVDRYVERKAAERRRDDLLTNTVVELLHGHGLPTHWQVIADMAIDVWTGSPISRRDVYRVLRRRKEVFVTSRPGVYRLASAVDDPE